MIHALPGGSTGTPRRSCRGAQSGIITATFFRANRPEFPLRPADVQQLIVEGLPGAEVSVASDDGTHFEARIVSGLFDGKRPLARHQLVYQALGARMGREIHALSMRTLTPQEAQRDISPAT